MGYMITKKMSRRNFKKIMMKNKRLFIIVIIILIVAVTTVGIAYGIYSGVIAINWNRDQEPDVTEEIVEEVTSKDVGATERQNESRIREEKDEQEEILMPPEPVLDESVEITDTYCVNGNDAVFYVYMPGCKQYQWEYYNKKTAKWEDVVAFADIKMGEELDEYNRLLSTLTVPAKKEYDAIEVRCKADNNADDNVPSAQLYVIDPFDAISVPEKYETTACKLLYANRIPVKITYKDGEEKEIVGLQGLFFSYEVSTTEDIKKQQNEVTQTITTVSAEERSYMPMLGDNQIKVRYRKQANTQDYDINIIGKDDQSPIILSYEINDYQVASKDTKDGTEISIKIKAEDNCTPASDLLYYFGLDTEKNPEKACFSSESVQSIKTNKNGMYGIYVMDNAGNIAKEQIELIVVDGKAPNIVSVSVEYPDMNKWYDSNIIHVEAEDKSDLSYSYSCNGIDSGFILDNFYTVTTNGIWTVTVKDAAGNISDASLTISNIDHMPPTILHISQEDAYTRRSNNQSERGIDGNNGERGENGEKTNGQNGLDGTDGTGAYGKNGTDGQNSSGKDGNAGQNGSNVPGRDGIDGKDGRDGIDGKDGKNGRDGKDGKSVTGPKGDTGADGKDGNSLFVRYSSSASGAEMTEKPTATSKYMGTYVGQEASSNPSEYTWTRYSDATISYSDGTLYIVQ